MSHALHHTKAFVLRTRNSGDSSQDITLFTRELGVVHARAQGVRKLASKLRYHLQELQCIEVSLVRGKEIWRLVSAVGTNELSPGDKVGLRVMRRLFSLIIRLMPDEWPAPDIYDRLQKTVALIRDNPDWKVQEGIELHFVLALLSELGYLALPQELSTVVESFSPVSQETIQKERGTIVRLINEALVSADL